MDLESEHPGASPDGGVEQTGWPEHQPARPAREPKLGEPSSRRSVARRLWPGFVLAVLLVAIGILGWQHNQILDWAWARGYHPQGVMQEIVQADTMTAYARRLFYANRPEIQSRDEFNRHCSSDYDVVAVLGCYTGNRHGIYLYNVTDARLEGIQQVTAAHEMLHQAYDRLSDGERKQLDAQLLAYAKTVTDTDLLAKFDAYKKTEPNAIANEMHSLFGTEVANLPEGLEHYYARYFIDRHKVTRFHDRYQAAFNQRTQQIAAYDAQLDLLKQQIEVSKASIASQEAALQAEQTQLDAYRASSQIAKYNAAVPSFNQRVEAYKVTVATANDLISQYNKLIDARNDIAVQEQQLQHAIDSHAASAPEQ